MKPRTVSQTDNPIFYEVKNYLDHLLMPEIYVMPNFVKIVRAVLENVNQSLFTRFVFTDRQTSQFFARLSLILSSSLARNACNTKFCENR